MVKLFGQVVCLGAAGAFGLVEPRTVPLDRLALKEMVVQHLAEWRCLGIEAPLRVAALGPVQASLDPSSSALAAAAAAKATARGQGIEIDDALEQLPAHVSRSQPAARGVGVDESDDWLLHRGRRDELAHAILRLEVCPHETPRSSAPSVSDAFPEDHGA